MWAVAAVVAAVAGIAVALWLGSPPARVAPPAIAPRAGAAAPALLVHVAGAVRRPGLYELPQGSRVADAVEAARGPRRGADLDALNLALEVADGAKILVPGRGDSATVAAAPDTSGAAAVSVNTADQAALETIPGIGPVKAAAIVAHRAEIGGFQRIEQLLDVDGIGPATLDSIRDYITL